MGTIQRPLALIGPVLLGIGIAACGSAPQQAPAPPPPSAPARATTGVATPEEVIKPLLDGTTRTLGSAFPVLVMMAGS